MLREMTTCAVEHSWAMPPADCVGQNRHQMRRKWRFGPTFLGVMRWRTKYPPDLTMRCRLATCVPLVHPGGPEIECYRFGPYHRPAQP